jgi:hypothetical protein
VQGEDIMNARASSFALLMSASIAGTASAAPIDYTHWAEGFGFLTSWELASDKAKVYDLGPSSADGIRQYAIKISLDPDAEDDGARNAVLFECGMHAREWFAAESCYWLIDHLLNNASLPAGPKVPSKRSVVPELLQHADVWVLPQTNPAGREIDDPALGDPTTFARACKGGADEGDPCAFDSDCDSNDCYSSGWRTNANRSACGAGVDLARNFSSGWGSAAACLTAEFMKYRGPDPMSELETLNLRRFVHDHMLSAATIVHTQARQTWNRWASAHDPTSFVVDELVALNLAGVGTDIEAHMPRSSVGGGFGQFSAWLTSDSNVAGELDLGTRRAISTFFLELPLGSPDYYDLAYGWQDYQDAPSDGSNTFHPSGGVMEEVWEDSIRNVFLSIIRQARSPQCPVNALGESLLSECLGTDFGLVGAKIASLETTKGLLRYDADTRREFLASGNRRVVFAVQNFSAGAATDTQATVRLRRDGVLVDTQVVPVSLATGVREVFSVLHGFVPGEYRVEIELDPDDFAFNDSKIFAFDVKTIGVELVPPYLLMGDPELRFPGLKPSRKRPATRPPRVARGDLRFTSIVLDAELLPDLSVTGAVVRVLPHVHPGAGPGSAQPQVWRLPAGAPWWDRSKPERGTWAYTDRDGNNGPVSSLAVRPTGSRSPKSARRHASLRLRVRDLDLRPLLGATSYTIELDLAGRAVLHGIAVGVAQALGPLEPPEEDIENEPR